MAELKKLFKDGKVAVLYSPGFGAGWSSWGERQHRAQQVFCPEIAELVIKAEELEDTRPDEAQKLRDQAEELSKELFPHSYTGGMSDLRVYWVPIGTRFRIDEYDGNERVVLYEEEDNVYTA